MGESSSKTKVGSVSKCGWHQNGWKEAEYGSHVEDIDEKMWTLTNPTFFLDHENFGCALRDCNPNETTIEQWKEMFESRIAAGATQKLPGWKKPHAQTVAWTDMLKNALSDTMNWQTRKWSKFQVLWPSIQAGWTWISWGIVRSLLANCLKMFVLGTNWTTWHSVVGQQACDISHKMESGMWQTTSKADFLHSSHKRFPTILSCG